MSKQVTISKTFGRKVTLGFNSWTFQTTVSETVEVNNAEEFVAASDKLFAQAKGLTQQDIDSVADEMQPPQ